MGIPAHGPVGSGKLRGEPGESEGAPKVPVGPRVSTIRQGVTGWNPISLPMSPIVVIAVLEPPSDGPRSVKLEGGCQSGTLPPSWPCAYGAASRAASVARKTVPDRHRRFHEILIAILL